MSEPQKKPDHYEVLGVAKNASKAEIKKAYRKKARETHPDRENGDKDAFQGVQAAYMVLSNAKTRDTYDRTGESGNVEPSIRQMACENLASLFLVVFKGNLNNISKFDIMKTVKAKIRAARVEPKSRLEQLQVVIGKINTAKSRMEHSSKSDAPDIFGNIIDAELRATTNSAAGEEKLIAVYEMMLILVKDYHYDFEKPVKSTSRGVNENLERVQKLFDSQDLRI